MTTVAGNSRSLSDESRKMASTDPYDLKRFIDAQEGVYETALAELKNGQKRTHWMWFIFPQVDGLGLSETSKFFAIKNIEEVRQYLVHPVLGSRLKECSQVLLDVDGRSALQIFGSPDDLKLNSSMTLFASVSSVDSLFQQVLDKYYHGEKDSRTLEIMGRLKRRG